MRTRRRHPAGCGHCTRPRELGRQFQAWRAAWESELEAASNGYATEAEIFRQTHPAPTFRRYLEDMAS